MKKIFAVIAMTLALSGCLQNGDGEKVGQITKVSKEGAFCPTWEAEIIRGGFNGGTGVQGQAFRFTIENNDALLKQVQDAMNKQQEVKIHYKSEVVTFCRSEHNNFLTGIEVISAPSAAKAPFTSQLPPDTPIQRVDDASGLSPEAIELAKVLERMMKKH